MGVVWKAEDTRLHRPVALKLVPEGRDRDAQAVDRHLREARTASALNHPNICSIYDIGEWQGRRFIVMELLEGASLEKRIDGTPLETEKAIEIGVQLSDALVAAHGKGIIHRDIKPANVVVVGERTASPQAKILDFGLAKLADEPALPDEATRTRIDRTAPGTVVGTVSYMSPEQALGKELDARTDIFSLGIVLYEMITGSRAFAGATSAAVFDAILNRAPTAPVELNADVPAELQRIVDKALEKDPAQRYQSAAELRADLQRLRQGVPAAAVEKGRWLSRMTAVVIALPVVAVAAYFIFQGVGRDRPASKGPSIAVLRFETLSGDPDQDYFSNGLTQEIITELTHFPDLFVIARDSTSRYPADIANLRDVGQGLGVRYALTGSVLKAGETIRVIAELSDTVDGVRLWRESYTRDLTASDFFGLQDELTQQVVNAIAGSSGALSRAGLAEARRKPPSSLDSYDCVLQAYEYLHIHEPAVHLRARECLETAVVRDPDYADAWAWLAYIYAEEQRHRWNLRAESYDELERALDAAGRAADLDPANQVAHGALALTHFQRRDFDRFRAEAERTVELNPNNALWLAYMGLRFCTLDECDRGLPMARRALSLNPSPPYWYYLAGFWDLYRKGRLEEALAEVQKIPVGDYRIAMYRAATYARLGRPAEARRAFDEIRTKGIELPDDPRRDMIEHYAMAPAVVVDLMDGLAEADLP